MKWLRNSYCVQFMFRRLLPLLLVLIALPAAASDYSLNISSPFTVYDPGARASITAYVTGCCRVNDPTQATVTIPLPPGSTNISAPGRFGGWACSFDGATAEEIALRFPGLRLADIHSCISYCLNHQDEVDKYLADRERSAAALRERISTDPLQQQGVDEMRERIKARQARTDCGEMP